jgi:hypothetical protein
VINEKIWPWLRERFLAVVDGIAASALVGVLALLVGGRLRIPTPVLSVVAFGILCVLVFFLRRRSAWATNARHVERTKVGETLDLGHLAMEMSWRTKYSDKTHRFHLYEETYTVIGRDGKFIYHYQGFNATKFPSSGIRDITCGDSPIDAGRMNIEARDLLRGGKKLAWKVVSDHPYVKIVEIVFQQPIASNEEFDIEWSCDWPGTFTRSTDYVFFTWWRRRRGTDTFRGRLVLAAPPGFVQESRYYGRHSRTEAEQPTITETDGRTIICYETDEPILPKGYIYQIEFGRTDLTDLSA